MQCFQHVGTSGSCEDPGIPARILTVVGGLHRRSNTESNRLFQVSRVVHIEACRK